MTLFYLIFFIVAAGAVLILVLAMEEDRPIKDAPENKEAALKASTLERKK